MLETSALANAANHFRRVERCFANIPFLASFCRGVGGVRGGGVGKTSMFFTRKTSFFDFSELYVSYEENLCVPGFPRRNFIASVFFRDLQKFGKFPWFSLGTTLFPCIEIGFS